MLDFSKGEHMAPAYAALNPNCRMPTFKDDDYVLWESNAIMRYIAIVPGKAAVYLGLGAMPFAIAVMPNSRTP